MTAETHVILLSDKIDFTVNFLLIFVRNRLLSLEKSPHCLSIWIFILYVFNKSELLPKE